MSALKRVFSIGKDKKQSPPVCDVEAVKRSISRPQALAPKHVIDEQIRLRKAARLEAEGRESEIMVTQPSPAGTFERRISPEGTFKRHLKVVFEDVSKPLPPTPSAKSGGLNAMIQTAHKRDNLIKVSLNRKSAASSFWCCGQDEQDLADQAVVQTQRSNNIITETSKDGPVLVFRNEEERQQACRVLATLRESRYLDDSEDAEPAIPRCGRDCSQCLKARSTSGSRHSPSDPPPQIVVYVTRDPGGIPAGSHGHPTWNETDMGNFIADELESQFHDWRASRAY